MSENNQMMSVEGQLVGMPLAGPESFSQQQLEYLKRAMGVDETVLYTVSGNSGVASCTLSEVASNFEYLDFTVGYTGGDNGISVVRFPGSTTTIHIIYGAGIGTTDYLMRVYGTISGTSVEMTKSKCMSSAYTSTSAESIRNDNSGDLACIFKVVGIHRISGGNQ